MLTVTYTEPMVNAVRAALDDRINSMRRQLVRLESHPASQSRTFAIETTEEAIRDAMSAALATDLAMDELGDYPADMTIDRFEEWTSGELIVGFGK